MSTKLNKREIEKFSRQIILKNIGALGQRKIREAKVLIIGMGGLGCPAAEFLTRSGIGTLGIIDHDRVSLSNIHRQTLYTEKNVNKSKVKIAKKKLNEINPKTKINIFNYKLNKIKFNKIILYLRFFHETRRALNIYCTLFYPATLFFLKSRWSP